MNPLLQRFNAERKAFAELRKQGESKVVRWEYWDWPEWHWNPDYFPEARRQGKRVPKDNASYGYGYDKANRVVVIHRFDRAKLGKARSMDFLRYTRNAMAGSHFIAEAIYEGNTVVGSDFQAGGVLSDVFEATFSEGRIARVEHLRATSPPWDWKTIEWQGDAIATVLVGMRGRKAHQRIRYGEAGQVLEDFDLSKPAQRKPLPKGVSMKSLAKQIRERLPNAVVAAVTKARIKEPVYCLALNYDCEGNPLLLPELGIGLESERRARLKRGGPEAKLDIWEPEQFSVFANTRTALKDKKLEQACDSYNRELEYNGSQEPARKLILEAAKELAKMDWSGKLNTTDDFIVYAVDTDGADLHMNLKLTVPPKQLARLKAAKLL